MYIISYILTIRKDMNFQITTKSKCLVAISCPPAKEGGEQSERVVVP